MNKLQVMQDIQNPIKLKFIVLNHKKQFLVNKMLSSFSLVPLSFPYSFDFFTLFLIQKSLLLY